VGVVSKIPSVLWLGSITELSFLFEQSKEKTLEKDSKSSSISSLLVLLFCVIGEPFIYWARCSSLSLLL